MTTLIPPNVLIWLEPSQWNTFERIGILARVNNVAPKVSRGVSSSPLPCLCHVFIKQKNLKHSSILVVERSLHRMARQGGIWRDNFQLTDL